MVLCKAYFDINKLSSYFVNASCDYEKAFDSLETSAAIKRIGEQRIEEIYVKILEDIYEENTATTLHYTTLPLLSKKILIRTWIGKRQEFR